MRTPAFTASAMVCRCIWPGMTSFCAEMTATRGRSSSSSVRPSAFRRLRCGARASPFLMASLRSCIGSTRFPRMGTVLTPAHAGRSRMRAARRGLRSMPVTVAPAEAYWRGRRTGVARGARHDVAWCPHARRAFCLAARGSFRSRPPQVLSEVAHGVCLTDDAYVPSAARLPPCGLRALWRPAASFGVAPVARALCACLLWDGFVPTRPVVAFAQVRRLYGVREVLQGAIALYSAKVPRFNAGEIKGLLFSIQNILIVHSECS